MKKWISFLIVPIFLIPLSFESLAGQGVTWKPQGGDQDNVWGTSSLGKQTADSKVSKVLEQEKQEQIRKVLSEHSGKIYELRSNLFAKRAELNAQLLAKDPNNEEVDCLVGQINEFNNKLLRTRIEMIMELKKKDLFYFDYQMLLGNYGFTPAIY